MNVEKKAEKSKAKKIISLVVNILIWLFVAFAVFITILAFAAQSSPDGVPSIGGKAILTVVTDSMKPEFEAGDIIIGQKLSAEEQLTLKVGDVITFDAGDIVGNDNVRDLNSHRIISINTDDSGAVTSYVTRGDNNPVEDTTPVTPASVICKWNGTRIKGLGNALAFLQKPTGFLIAIVLPLLLFFIYELVIFIRKFLEVKNSGKKQITAADEELIKQKAIEEYIKSQQKAEENPAGTEDVPAEPEEVPSDPEETVPEESAEE